MAAEQEEPEAIRNNAWWYQDEVREQGSEKQDIELFINQSQTAIWEEQAGGIRQT